MSERAKDRPVVALDGPAGAGKSTVARAVAKALGFLYVDTGALYRGVALAAKEKGVSWEDGEALGALTRALDLDFEATDEGPRLLIDGIDRAPDIRTPDVADGASKVSQHEPVRAALLDVQRQLGAAGAVVFEGRDIGTVVFPDAEVKLFLTATPEARARRRVGDLMERGKDADYGSILEAIRERDARDSSRAVAPLKPAADATTLDTTDLGFDEVVEEVVAAVREAMAR